MDKGFIREVEEYFGRRAFSRLFSLFKSKIESLGYVSGSVKIAPSDEERTAIESWMGIAYGGKTITISLSKFENRLIGSKFEEITLYEMVELITKESIIPKKERERREEEKKNAFFRKLREGYPHPYAQVVVRRILEKEKGSSRFIALYNEQEYDSIEVILRAISNLPPDGEFEKLPLFAERITGNPHFFDKNKKLYQAIEMVLCEKEDRDYRSNLNAEDEVNLLAMVGLEKDDLHSFVTCYGLVAFREDVMLQQWYWANQEESVQNIPLRALRHIDTVKPVIGKKVFVLENSGVYSSILDKIDGVYPIVCTHGNFKLSGMLLLDKLIKSGAEIYYSGDIDVNGIAIAKYLKNKYKESVRIWRMGLDEYRKSASKVPLTNAGLERLNLDESDEFYEVVNEMQHLKVAGYQEPLLNLFVFDITEGINEKV
ncbi:TIGR02679 domain-containing protein [Alkalihalobacillus sp. MEB130]|uniref:TIGR02679 domain-containing protein n=1 Tax=Alkalihalobacillus sp. MEB130 TaxID=2976704 RepID=UPI0028DF2C69|nr:TIGR02679 domain-containing protein [Alkalihalobacillus sp. MEB130]MDT8860534.1 TIGR02679 domain-containing protein [Alkalihalobacillus sp. MEB130]